MPCGGRGRGRHTEASAIPATWEEGTLRGRGGSAGDLQLPISFWDGAFLAVSWDT